MFVLLSSEYNFNNAIVKAMPKASAEFKFFSFCQ